MKLNEKVIVVTGSSRGIGKAIAEACAKEGGKVVICSRDEKSVVETCNSMASQGFEVVGISIDVSREEDLKKLFSFSLERFGRIDVWINNAGLSGGYRMLYDLDASEIENIIRVNITGVLQACRIIIPYFIENKGGIVINMSGRGGRGEEAPYMTTYAASKAAVTNLTKSLASEFKGYPVTICSIMPGMVETDFYNNIKVSPSLEARVANIPLVLKAFGVSKEMVGKATVKIAARRCGFKSGKQYSLLGLGKVFKAILVMLWFRVSGKFK